MSVFQMFFFPIAQGRALDWLGVILIWIILLMSIAVVALILQFALRYRRRLLLPPDLLRQVDNHLAQHRPSLALQAAEADDSYLARLLCGVLKESSQGLAAAKHIAEEVGDHATVRMLRPLEWLNLLGNIGPMLGLFGTVYGIIVAFADLLAAGGKPDPAKLAGGISTALVTTFWGLIVAIPALSAYSLLRNKIDELTTEGILIAQDLARKHAAALFGPEDREDPGK